MDEQVKPVGRTRRPHLAPAAYQSLLRRAAEYEEKDWDQAQRFERHAINAALDLRVERELNAEVLNAVQVAWEWFDDRGDGAPDAASWEKQALNMAANLREVLRKARGE